MSLFLIIKKILNTTKYKNSFLKFKFFIIFFCNIIILFIIILDKIKRVHKKYKIFYEIIDIYSILFDTARNGYNKPIFPYVEEKKYPINKNKGGILICSIGKNENLYIREFVEYYILLGVNKIIIYDNNDIGGEKMDEILKDYLINKQVDIIDVRGMTSIQIPIYNYCYHHNKNLFDWIGLIDLDEYVYIKNNENINYYLFNKIFEKCELIFLNWLIYNDNNLLKYDKRPLKKRFTDPKILLKQGKSFVRGGFNNLLIPSTHIPGININYFCNSNGHRIFPLNFIGNNVENNSKAFIIHYYTKTVEEFCNKINRGNAFFNKKNPRYIESVNEKIKRFFLWNKITDYKIQILENCTGINLFQYKQMIK